MHAEPQKEHHWLQKLVGEWTFECECSMGPDQPAMKWNGADIVRSFGGLWTIGESQGELPGGGGCQSIMTLGFDPESKRFVGTFVAAEGTRLWIYDGALDAAEKVLTLDTEGPKFTGEGLAKYQDIIEFVSDDHRTLSSQILGDDGQWQPFMKAHYRRKR